MKNSKLAFLAPIVVLFFLLSAGWAYAAPLTGCRAHTLGQSGRPGETVQVCESPAPSKQAKSKRCKIIVINGDTVISCPTLTISAS